MKSCKKCGMLSKDCQCNVKQHQSVTGPCQKCGEVHHVKYLRDYDGLEVCADCLTIAQLEPSEREYFRVVAEKYRFPLVAMPLHLQVANIKNMALEEYLATLPRNREQFAEYHKDGITIGGVTL